MGADGTRCPLRGVPEGAALELDLDGARACLACPAKRSHAWALAEYPLLLRAREMDDDAED